MKKDSDRSYYHLTQPRSALFFEQWMEMKLGFDSIEVPFDQQPLNGDDEDFAPQSQYPFRNSKTRSKERYYDWIDLGLEELAMRGVGEFDKTIVSGPMFDNDRKGELPDYEVSSELISGQGSGDGSGSGSDPGASSGSEHSSGSSSSSEAGSSHSGMSRTFGRSNLSRAPR